MRSETKVYKMERRTFLQLSAAAVLAGGLIDIDAAYANSDCSLIPPANVSSIPGSSYATAPGNDILYWIDGPMNITLPNYQANDRLQTRARISCVIDVCGPLIGDNDYIESVTLVEVSGTEAAPERKLIQRFFYGPEVTTSTNFQPYTIFENVDINPNYKYELIFVRVQNQATVTYYRHIITNPEPSRFDYNHILSMQNDHRTAQFVPYLLDEIRESNEYRLHPDGGANPAHHHNDAAKTLQKSGYINTPYGVAIGGPHTCRARILKIDTSGANPGDFEVEIEFMHGDADDTHYMRYFLVTDPVGRLLGGVRRVFDKYKDSSNADKYAKDDINAGQKRVLVKRGIHVPQVSCPAGAVVSSYCKATGEDTRVGEPWKYTYDGINYGRLFGTYRYWNGVAFVEREITTADSDVTRFFHRSILDCPHINIFTDDRFHAVAKASIRLR